MTRKGTKFLDSDDRFPELELHLISGQILKLPQEIGEGYCTILFYRGYW
jgi:hypothetical protein